MATLMFLSVSLKRIVLCIPKKRLCLVLILDWFSVVDECTREGRKQLFLKNCWDFEVTTKLLLSIFTQKYLRKCKDIYFILQNKYLCIYEDSFGAKTLIDDCALTDDA